MSTVTDHRHDNSTASIRHSGEKTAWWIVFGVLVASIVLMLGAWN